MTVKMVLKVSAQSKREAYRKLRKAIDDVEDKKMGLFNFRAQYNNVDVKVSTSKAWDEPKVTVKPEDHRSPWGESSVKFQECATKNDDKPTLLIYESKRQMSPGIPYFVSIGDGESICGFSSEEIVDCIQAQGATEIEFSETVAGWLWEDHLMGKAAIVLLRKNLSAQGLASTLHWRFRRSVEGTVFPTPNREDSARYVQEEIGEVCRVYNLIKRPGDIRNNRKDVTEKDLFSELADLWLMLDTAQQQTQTHGTTTAIPNTGDPLTDVQISVNHAIAMCLTYKRELPIAEILQMAKDSICHYPGFDLSFWTRNRLAEWSKRVDDAV